MARGYALLTGLKSVNPVAYGGWNGQNGCWGCELDVDNVKRVLAPLGYSFGVLKTEQATSSNILAGLRGAAKNLGPDDIFVFYYSGHGGQQQDYSGDEFDSKDETLMAYDKEIVDDELNEIWPLFRNGTRIVMISDSCNSGTNYKMMPRNISFESATPIRMFSATRDTERSSTISAQMIHYSGCRDGHTSAGYASGGAFTNAFCRAWENGGFRGNYSDLYSRILNEIKSEIQKPQFSEYGPVTDAFRNQLPFTVIPGGASSTALPIPTREEVSSTLAVMPVAWLHQPSLAENGEAEPGARIAPLAAAIIGVAMGAGIQLGSQALNRAISARQTELTSEFRCTLPYPTIEQLACDLADAAQADDDIANTIRAIVMPDNARPFPVAVAAFLAGVAAGATAARP